MKVSPILLLAGILSISTAVIAAEIPTFEKADADKSGFVDDKEFAPAKDAGAPKSFADLDKDEDGKLSKKEYSVILEEECE